MARIRCVSNVAYLVSAREESMGALHDNEKNSCISMLLNIDEIIKFLSGMCYKPVLILRKFYALSEVTRKL